MAARKTLSVSNIVKNVREEIADKRQRLAMLIKHKDALNAALVLLSPLGRLADDTSISPWIWPGCYEDHVELTISFDIAVDSLRSEVLADMVTLAEGLGFENGETVDNIWNERSASRGYRWKGKVGYVIVNLRVNANVGRAAACKVVQVGTKTEEKPVYEIICEE